MMLASRCSAAWPCACSKAAAGDIGRECLQLGGKIWEGLIDGGKGVIVIAVLLASASLLVTVLSASGLGVKFSQLLLGFGGDYLVGVLLISALLCIMLGMDVPTTASYLLTASVAAPALVKLGLAPLTAHLFIFYFAILSAITPPVCASVYAAATIVGREFLEGGGTGAAHRRRGVLHTVHDGVPAGADAARHGTGDRLPRGDQLGGDRRHLAAARSAICWAHWAGRAASTCMSRPRPCSIRARSQTLIGVALVLAFLVWRWQAASTPTVTRP